MDAIHQEIKNCKSRLNEIAQTRPGTMELSKEYMETQERLKALELKLMRDANAEFAHQMPDFDVRWDLRTDQVKMLMDLSVNRQVWILFKHAETVRDELSLMYCFQFNNALDVKSSREDFTETKQYVHGVVGLNNLGLFEIANSKWMEAKSLASDSGYRHFCLVYANVVVDVLASEVTGKQYDQEKGVDLVNGFIEVR